MTSIRKVLLITSLLSVFFGFQNASATIISGSACYRFSDNESINSARSTTLSLAKKDALERYSVYVRSTSEVENYTLRENIINSLTVGLIKKIRIIDKKEDLYQRKICRTIEGVVDSTAIEKAISDAIKDFQSKNIVSKTTIEGLQKIIKKQNKNIEDLRRKSHDTQYKKRLSAIIHEQQRTIKQLEQKSRSIPYTTRKYDENLAFINIGSAPQNIDVYINDQWIGKTPIAKYEIEAGIRHKITLRGDPRYFDPHTIHRTYKKFERSFENIELIKCKSKILILSEYKIEHYFVNSKFLPVYQGNVMLEVDAGFNDIIVKDGNGYARFKLETWKNDIIRKNITQNEYVRKPSEVIKYDEDEKEKQDKNTRKWKEVADKRERERKHQDWIGRGGDDNIEIALWSFGIAFASKQVAENDEQYQKNEYEESHTSFFRWIEWGGYIVGAFNIYFSLDKYQESASIQKSPFFILPIASHKGMGLQISGKW